MTRNESILLIVAGGLAIAGCSKKAPEELPPAPIGTETAQDDLVTDPYAVVPGSQEDFLAQVAADRVFFDTDRFDIDSADRATLDSQAAWLQQYPNVRVTIEGHADERGTRDYNLALGERRANAAKNYLASIGIAPSRITVVSFGKERPAALGSNEEAWALNRRSVTVTVQ